MASSSSSSSGSWKYDVFVSFSGEDTRKTFVDHLYHALHQQAILTYKDDATLDRGDTIGPSLMKAIETSKILVIIFSENYADSTWCLDELSHIMKCKEQEDSGQIVLPIFYNVDPSDVRKQKRKYGEAFAKHELSENNKDKVESWKKALVDASSIAGWEPKHVANGHEARCIQEIVRSILDILSSSDSTVDDDENLVGMGTRLQQLRSHLRIGSDGVRMVGIWGVGGGGKTTLATYLYMKCFADFDGGCFVENIREESRKQLGLKSLQEKILSTVFDKQMEVVFDKQMEVESVELGKDKIKQMLCRRKVLIVLDDVDHLDQLKALAGCRKWFGDGSRILITTRDQQLLTSHRVDELCPVSLLSDDEAIRLFKRHACPEDNPVQDCEKLSLHVITYVNGVPLALKILGAFLYGKDKDEWITTLARLKDHPEMDIVEKLKISYDGLEPSEKELFLDIACFHRGTKVDDAMKILDACGFYPDIGVKVLIKKCLITVSKDGKFDMHDLVQEMGHDIVSGEHPDSPENHSRVWRTKDIEDICFRNATMESVKIEAIECDASGCSSDFIMLVSKMKKLRFLKVTSISFDEGPSFLSNNLRYLSWSHYPASPFPQSFQPRKLVVLKIEESLQKELWKGYKFLPCLKELQLDCANALVRTPDFGGLPCLQELILEECESLEEIHQSLGNHSSLVHVNVSNCKKLTRFPTIVKMEKLEILEISYCEALIEFPKIETNMDSLVELLLSEVGIEVLPSSIGECCTKLTSLRLEDCSKLKIIDGNFHALEGLKTFELYGCKQFEKFPKDLFNENLDGLGLKLDGSSIKQLIPSSVPRFLRKLDLSWFGLKDGDIPNEIGELSSLRELYLWGNDFTRLDFSLSRLTHLKLLELSSCQNLVELPELPSSLAILNANECESLKVIKDDAHRRCKLLSDVSIRGRGKDITGWERLLESMLQGKAVKSGCMILQLKGLEIPRGFEPRMAKGGTCRMQLPENWYNQFSGFLFCVILDNDYDFRKITIRMKHEKLIGDSMRMHDFQDYVFWEETVDDKHKNTCMVYISFGLLINILWWDQTSTAIQLQIGSLYDGYKVSGCGLKLIPKTSETTIAESFLDDVYDDYTCRLKILHDSKSAFKLYIDYSLPSNLNIPDASSSSSTRSWKYDVFLSFRGEDTRNTFVDHFYNALQQHGIHAYKKDATLNLGDTIGPALLSAIRESQVLVIIFSENYADSSWCLDELSYIMKCKEDSGQIVVPIFYNVDLSDVRKQTGNFGKAFAEHKQSKNKNKVEAWKKALVDASNISGWELKHLLIQAECIQEIIDFILDKLSSLDSAVEDEKLIGMGTRLQQVRSHLRIGSGDVRMVGIWGVGGGGKTTLATSLYMELSADFDVGCFVENIREESKQHGLESLQEKILSAVFDKEMHVESVGIGKHQIKRMLCRRNVLIVLDDVDHLEQLEALAGCHNWFGNGSRIIITTRDEKVLESHRVDEVCPVSLLSDDEAIRLFKRHAYQEHNPVKDYEKLSLHVITYVNGLPLALKILGAFLYGKDKDEWISTLSRLKDHPEMGIVEKLKISYDGLKPVEKELFLDIACLFRRKIKDEAMEILDACGFYPDRGVKVLIKKCLITVSKDGRFDMHDLVQEMGHYIVRGEHPYNPEKHSRVWRKEDIEDICSRNATMANDKIEAIKCDASGCSSDFIMLVSKMKKLRFLKVTTTPFDEGPTFLSNELKYIDWGGHPASLFPESFQPRKLIVLKLKRSLQKELWKGYKYLPSLKEMELSYMKALVRTPDFSALQCLQKLTLKGCDSLEEIHQSLGNHSNLVHVSVSICDKLIRFPTIVKMDKLKILRISECKALIEFPKIEAEMDNLVELYLYEVGIQVLPPSVGEYCTNLISLKLEWCSQLKSIQGHFHALKCLESFHVNSYNLGSIEGNLPRSSLTNLDLSWCKLKDGEIPSEIGELSNLRELHLKCNNFTRLDFSLSRLTRLKLLDMRRCENLVELPELPSSLAILNLDGCESLEVIKDDVHRRCKWLCDVSIQGDRKNIIGGERLLETMLQGNSVKSGCMILQLKGLEIPRGFEPRVVRGRRCKMQVPENWHNLFSGFLFCIVLDNYSDYFDLPKITTGMKHEKLTGDYSDLPKIITRMKHKHQKLTGDSMSMRDSQDDVNETDNDKNTCMIYISFGLLRNTSWWDQTSTAIHVEIDSLDDGYRVSGCGSKLIPKTNEAAVTDSSFDDVLDNYTCRLKIRHDIFHVSESAFKFCIDYSLRPNLNVYLTTTQK